ncbi:hypothetical protein WR25_01997 [Diploscapter pachys]|uniref:EGF-like domain-containing protein n=1 Tax=Diploscapter pachys TaxID=2018661 RepID=A0A2A2L4I4_9BILA|nr:hypothetical protein WR25_01997 [Diploscapter pachys]
MSYRLSSIVARNCLGLCTQPKKVLIDEATDTYRWACVSPNDCVCVNGTTNGTYACDTIIDQCTSNPCGADSVKHFNCTAEIGNYTCTCAAGYTGQNCDTLTGSACANNPCVNGGTCTDAGDGNYSCSCANGYNGSRCELFDYCGNNITCKNGGSCVNLFGGASFTCECTSPYTQGRYCEDSNAFYGDLVNDGCFNFDNSQLGDSSKYPLVFTDNSMTIEMCQAKLTSQISPIYTYFTVSGTACYLSNKTYLGWPPILTQNLDNNCKQACPGDNSEECGNLWKRAWVYTFNEINTDDNPCSDHPTLCGSSSQGVCVNMPTNNTDVGYLCICAPGYTGDNCESPAEDPCLAEPCQNNGTCVSDMQLYTYNCDCTEDYFGEDCQCTTGQNCENIIPHCVETTINGQSYPNPCVSKDSQAQCIEIIGSYECNCSSQWVGDQCDMNVIIRDVLLAIYGEINMEMVPLLDELMSNPALITDMVPYFLGMKSYDDRLPLSWSAEDIFEYISYEDQTIDINNAMYIFNDIVLGNCFTFNHNLNPNYTYLVRDGGTRNGLMAKIRVRQDEYVPWTDTAAIMVFVASRLDYIFAESTRYNSASNTFTIYDVFDTVYTRLDGRYGVCITNSSQVPAYYYPAAYDVSGCQRSCYQNMINASCGCMDPRYPTAADAIPCPLSQRACVEETSSKAGDPSTCRSNVPVLAMRHVNRTKQTLPR